MRGSAPRLKEFEAERIEVWTAYAFRAETNCATGPYRRAGFFYDVREFRTPESLVDFFGSTANNVDRDVAQRFRWEPLAGVSSIPSDHLRADIASKPDDLSLGEHLLAEQKRRGLPSLTGLTWERVGDTYRIVEDVLPEGRIGAIDQATPYVDLPATRWFVVDRIDASQATLDRKIHLFNQSEERLDTVVQPGVTPPTNMYWALPMA